MVVYKIDRLTRSLADFAKLVELFDRKSISFVAVTQQFNTTTSMGRLTLNVLLSFAQFERELSSERVRDKVAASRKKGKWTGGSVPLGYDSKDKKLVVNKAEAETVRTIFRRYLELKSFQRLVEDLDQKGIVTKARKISAKTIGAIRFGYGSLAYLLKNRTYLGETGHKESWFPGEHEPIVGRDVFDQVQQLLKSNSVKRKQRRQDGRLLLAGVLFDDRGNRMSPSFSIKGGVRYPFYVSAALLRGRKSEAGTCPRLPAADIEGVVLQAISDQAESLDETTAFTHRNLVDQAIARVVVGADKVTITLKESANGTTAPIEIQWKATKTRDLVRIDGAQEQITHAPNPQLVQAVVRAHTWVRSLIDGTYDTIEALGRAVDVHPKVIRNGIRLAYLAPEITKAILEGTQPPTMNLGDFIGTMPMSWGEQRLAFGIQMDGQARGRV